MPLQYVFGHFSIAILQNGSCFWHVIYQYDICYFNVYSAYNWIRKPVPYLIGPDCQCQRQYESATWTRSVVSVGLNYCWFEYVFAEVINASLMGICRETGNSIWHGGVGRDIATIRNFERIRKWQVTDLNVSHVDFNVRLHSIAILTENLITPSKTKYCILGVISRNISDF